MKRISLSFFDKIIIKIDLHVMYDYLHYTLLASSSSGYYVERRERGGEWLKVNNYPTPNTTFTVQDLHEGSRYEFRVIAVNEAGSGKPSKPTEPITAGYQRCKYIISII